MEITTGALTKVIGTRQPAPIQKQSSSVGVDAAYFSAAAFQEGIVAPMTAKQLRSWYETNPWIFAAVDQRCTDIANADWKVGPIDPKEKWNEDTAQRITDLMTAPNPTGKNDSYAGLWHPSTIDTLCLDKGAIQPLKDKGGEPYALKALDGARVFVKPRWQTNSDGPRYLYMNEDGTDGTPLMNDELIVISAHPSTYAADGLAPLKVLNRILIAEYDTFKSIHILQKNRAPSAILKMPGSSKQAVDAAKGLWLNELAGRSGLGFMNVPAESDLLVLGSTNLEEQGAFAFYDMLIRAIAACFRITTLNLNWLQDVNRATAQEQSHITDDGTVALLKLYQGYINREIVSCFRDSENIGFFYTQLMTKDEALSVTTVRDMMGKNVNPWSINQALQASGYDPVKVEDPKEQEYYDKPLVSVANGQMAPPTVAMTLPQYQPPPEPGAEPVPDQAALPKPETGRPNNANKPHVVDQVVGAAPVKTAYSRKGTPDRDERDAMDELFDSINGVFVEAQEAARSVLTE